MLGWGAAIFTILSYLRADTDDHPGIIEPVGKLFFMYGSAIMWLLFAMGVLSFQVKWDSGVFLDYTYMPVNGEEYLALVPGAFGLLQLLIGFAHSVEYFAARPLKEAADKLERGRSV
jgi:hypothetical protein